jgi:hypothetical protein
VRDYIKKLARETNAYQMPILEDKRPAQFRIGENLFKQINEIIEPGTRGKIDSVKMSRDFDK